jgi:hypothetical protein
MFSRAVSRFTSLRTRAIAQRFASTKVRFAVQFTRPLGLTYAQHIDLERDTSRGHSCQAGTTQTIGAVGLVWILRGLIGSLENGAFADGHWRC